MLFDRIWGIFKGVKEGIEVGYPSGKVTHRQVRQVVKCIRVNDYVICPNRREAARVFTLLKKSGCDAITRSIMWQGKPSVKVWRIR